MPYITAETRQLEDGQYFTRYFNTADTGDKPHNFKVAQDFVRIVNRGSEDIIITVSGTSKTIKPGKDDNFQTAVSGINVRSVAGIQPFLVETWASNNSGGGGDVANKAYESFTPTIGTTEINIPFSKPSTSIWVTNDGGADILFALNNNVTNPVTADSAQTATPDLTKFLMTPSVNWVYDPSGPFNCWKTSTAGASLQYDPGSGVVTQIGGTHATGNAMGIATITLSPDDGTTWLAPSAIPGVTRSDGATGTGMDSIDMNSALPGNEITYTLPYPAAWRIKYFESNTKNGTATGFTINIRTGKFKAGNAAVTVKAGETKVYPLVSNQIRLAATSGSQPVRVDVFE